MRHVHKETVDSMLFNFLYIDRSGQFDGLETVDAESIHEAIKIFVLADDIYPYYIDDLMFRAAYGSSLDDKYRKFAKKLSHIFDSIRYTNIRNEYSSDSAKEERTIRYKSLIRENLDDIITFFMMLKETYVFKIKPITRILTNPNVTPAVDV